MGVRIIIEKVRVCEGVSRRGKGLYCSLRFRDWKTCVRFMEEVKRIAEFLDERKEVYIYI